MAVPPFKSSIYENNDWRAVFFRVVGIGSDAQKGLRPSACVG